jgi:alkylation response protein AidB-like acyl-CoA dehydrogenase
MWISNAGFCSLFIVLLVGDDKNITGFIVENTDNNGISMEEEHKLGIKCFIYSSVFFTKLKFLLKTCYLKEVMVKIA